ncbi:polysaccharide deacetylase family protein [Pseudobutyrivibrio ruminis]|uniref:polysaccharide deacetylase family protein n=1 Tax=Pseudobutyrivibrio ruminis TaxID=46206 RepID=UPI00040D944E|nr:polysaccharide deacetylase family protein [Pseudobutyrivibrio ruminis]
MEKLNEELERQRAKRKRVARMKRFIVTTILSFMLITFTTLGVLCYQVISLKRELKEISKMVYVSTDVADSNEMVDDSILDDVYKVDDIDNIAEEGDIPKVYLTFDDGPSSNTEEILNILDDYNVKATFFVCGKDLELYGDDYKRIVDDGHTIGMHSYSHNFGDIYSSGEAFAADYMKIHDLILNTTGVDTKYYRFPGGSSNKVSSTSMSTFINYLNEQGAVYFDWNVASGDATSQAFTSEQLIDNVMKDVVKYKSSVVLLHDASNKNATVEALPGLIESLQEQGAMILPITDETTIIQHVNVVQ